MNDNKSLFSFNEFVSANSDKKIIPADYIHAICTLNKMPSDLFLCMVDFLSPGFVIIDGYIFLENQFETDSYEKYRSQGMKHSEIQFWMNLVSVSGVFSGIEQDKALSMAKNIVDIWNLKMLSIKDNSLGKARAFYDDDEDGVFITVDVD